MGKPGGRNERERMSQFFRSLDTTRFLTDEINGAFDKICAADGCSMKHSGNAIRSGRAGRRRFHAKNFLVVAAGTFAAGLAPAAPARRVAAQPDRNRNLPPFSVRSRAR